MLLNQTLNHITSLLAIFVHSRNVCTSITHCGIFEDLNSTFLEASDFPYLLSNFKTQHSPLVSLVRCMSDCNSVSHYPGSIYIQYLCMHVRYNGCML